VKNTPGEDALDQFAACWEGLDDPRSGNAGLHDFDELLMMALCTVLCGGQGAVDMAEFAKAKEPFLLGFLKLENGVPSHDTFSRLFRQLDVDQGGDYALALKGNQGTLHDDVVQFLDDPASQVSTAKPNVDAGHGRIETRTAMVSTEIAWLQSTHQWPGLTAIGKVERIRETPAKTTTDTAFYLLSAALSPERLNDVARSHWASRMPCIGGSMS